MKETTETRKEGQGGSVRKVPFDDVDEIKLELQAAIGIMSALGIMYSEDVLGCLIRENLSALLYDVERKLYKIHDLLNNKTTVENVEGVSQPH
jgi:hypothetical protein